MPEVMQVVPKTYDLILWLIPRLKHFPRDQRFLLGDRIQSAALDVLCLLIEANYTRSRTGLLRSANLELEKLRYLVRLSSDLHYLNRRRYQHAAERIDEIGRLIGGWTKADRRAAPPRRSREADGVPSVRATT
jgi:four helix bundle protein